MNFPFINKIKIIFAKILTINKFEKAPSLSKLEELAIEGIENARTNFNNADEGAIDLAIYELMTAEERLNILIKERKKEAIR